MHCNRDLLPQPHPDTCMTRFVSLQAKLDKQAIAAVAADAPDPRGWDAAILVMEAVLFSFMWGHLPPPRAGVLLSMHPPGFQGPCIDKDCMHPDECLGNRVFGGRNEQEIYMHLPHHKEEAKWGYKSAKPYLLPSSMLLLLQHYLGWAREKLLQWVSQRIKSW